MPPQDCHLCGRVRDLRVDLSIYLAAKSGIVFGDILASSPIGLVAGVTFEPLSFR